MSIPAVQVKQLRDKSGAGMMDAKRALVACDGDMEAALDWLRTKGLAKAAKKSGRTAAEGLVGVAVDSGTAALVEVNAETDFVANNKEFQQLVREVSRAALAVEDVDTLRAARLGDGTVEDAVVEKIATIGENMSVRRMVRLEGEHVAHYIHNSVTEGLGKIGTLVAITGSDTVTARQIAMHVAASNPIALSEENLDPSVADREKTIIADQARQSGKPESAIEKITAGRWRKFREESILLDQKFVMNSDETVRTVAERTGITIVGFARFEVGEGIEKEQEDFAAEVAKAMEG
ncbi:MAG: translation elongation factor Ts [Paracoccaceae bacterium]|nr:translation elongation factor Ts [Paracoccaceae bacterium]MDE2914936.1 translation elongation factor Ts [Paracoccaceae bacterium]